MTATKHSFTMPRPLATLVQQLDREANPVLLDRVKELLEKSSAKLATEPKAFLDALFLKAIGQRFGRQQAAGYIYLQQFEIPQIVLFDVLINKFPFVHLAQSIINDTVVAAIGEARHLVLVDVGIGRGIQTVRLIQALQHHPTLQQLTIVGVEPFREAIDHAQQVIKEAAAGKPFTVTFESINCLVEDMEQDVLEKAVPAKYDILIVNASLTLHHIPTKEQRHSFFRSLYALRPSALLLTEPNSDHLQPNWVQRVQNAYRHYGSVFSVIDKLNIDTSAKNGLKLFFGREIEDVVAHADAHRYERHEPGESWVNYCTTNGFVIQPSFVLAGSNRSPFINLTLTPSGYLAMEHGGLNVLSLVHAII